MIFFAGNVSGIFEDEEEEEEEELEAGIDDELLGELADDATSDDELLEELDPLLKSPLDVLIPEYLMMKKKRKMWMTMIHSTTKMKCKVSKRAQATIANSYRNS